MFTRSDEETRPFFIAAPLPEQYYSPLTSAFSQKVRGELALMEAILDDALKCYQKQFETKARREQRLAREAEEWFFSEDERWPFSFVNICAALGLDSSSVRAGLEKWRKTPPSKVSTKRRVVTNGRL